ncbi:MAG: hypothetical protein JST43_04005 [Bacteroidetes bacterium]|nr:hypothetical protein [Bacteroidota bacterium]MBS1541110.1 hypothetical protein [Bacteroidota bacterium]
MDKSIFIFLIITTISWGLHAQDNQVSLAQQAQQQIDTECHDKGAIKKFALDNNISGKATFDITINHKGQVITVFLVESDIADVTQRNGLVNALSKLKIKDVSLPKKERFKFTYHLSL